MASTALMATTTPLLGLLHHNPRNRTIHPFQAPPRAAFLRREGCDASILIDSTKNNTAEKDSPANLSLRGYEIIDKAKEELEKQCPGTVSCADILAMSARDAIFFAGGPVYDIATGRKDGKRSKIEDTINLPSPASNSSQLIKAFGRHGLNVREMVALSGIVF